MIKLFRWVILVAVLVAAIGLYRGWIHVSSQNTGNNTDINVNVDKDKIRQDTTQATHELKQLGQEAKSKVISTTQPS